MDEKQVIDVTDEEIVKTIKASARANGVSIEAAMSLALLRALSNINYNLLALYTLINSKNIEDQDEDEDVDNENVFDLLFDSEDDEDNDQQ